MHCAPFLLTMQIIFASVSYRRVVADLRMMKKSPYVESFFMLMGKHSTNIWLVHTFFCYYYFHDFIYGLKYPILIYILTLGLSVISSVVINKLYQLLFGKISSYIH